MNRFYFLYLSLFTLITTTTLCQQVVDFPADNAVWDIDLEQPPQGSGNTFTNQMIRYYVTGDTLINNLKYKKIVKQFGFKYQEACAPANFHKIINNTISSPNYYAAIRTDSNLIVKTIFAGTNTEINLYKFNLEIGDTVLNKNQIVSKIETITINNIPIKKYTVENDNENTWFDGIGSISGLFFPYTFRELSENITLSCYKESKKVLINTHNWDEYGCYPCGLFDGTITGLNENKVENNLEISYWKRNKLKL